VSDYHPISSIHAIAKIIPGMLATRLGPLINNLVSNAQNAVIKKRSIHGKICMCQPRNKIPQKQDAGLLFKLYIRKAFDSVHWEYIIDLLLRRGFPS
jgi:hypothetical protein